MVRDRIRIARIRSLGDYFEASLSFVPVVTIEDKESLTRVALFKGIIFEAFRWFRKLHLGFVGTPYPQISRSWKFYLLSA